MFFILFWMAVLGAAAAADDKDIPTLGPPLLSGAEVDYPPFCTVYADGQANGFAVELLCAMGRDVTFRVGPWAQVKGWLEKGEVEALPLVGRTPECESVFDFTFPYMTLYGAIVARNHATDIRDLGDLAGKRVAVMQGDSAEEFLRRQDRGFEIHTTKTFEEALRALSLYRYDAVVIQRLVALRLIQTTGLSNLRVVNQPITGFRQDFCLAVKEGDHELLALLNEGLALDMRVQQRTARLEAANKELEAFAYSVSHDLRAQLRAVDGYTGILMEEHASRLDDEGRRFCAVISTSTRIMGKLIDDLLAFSRIGRAAMQPSSVDMEVLARSIFLELTNLAGRECIDFHVDPLPSVVADPTLIRQVRVNRQALLSMPIKLRQSSTVGRKSSSNRCGFSRSTPFPPNKSSRI